MPTLAEQIAPKPQQPSGLGGWLASIGDEMAGAFARYGRRSGAQRDASLALLNQASAPGTDPIMGAGQKLLGLAGLITHPLAFFPTGDEWRERLNNAGNNGRMGQAIGGMLGDLPSIVDPHLLAGGAGLTGAMFIGPMAKTFPHAKVPIAEKLEAAGHTASDIRDMTGLHRGADSKWRAEIDDSQAKLLVNPSEVVPGQARGISGWINHPDLFDAYPALRNVTVKPTIGRGGAMEKTETGGNLWVGSGGGMLNGASLSPLERVDHVKGVTLHELQHAIQDLEGFNYGASLLNPLDKNQVDAYWKSAGEVEARNVQNRMKMSAADRLEETNAPWFTQDVPTSEQIVKFGGNTAQSTGGGKNKMGSEAEVGARSGYVGEGMYEYDMGGGYMATRMGNNIWNIFKDGMDVGEDFKTLAAARKWHKKNAK